MAKNPQNVTVAGRLSFPVFSHAEAVARNAKGKYPQSDPAKVKPEFNLVLEADQLTKLTKHLKDVFIPWCVERERAGEKKNILTAKQAEKLNALIDSLDWEEQPPYLPIKPVPEKTVDLAPDGVAMVKVTGSPGRDIEQKALVYDEDELAVPDPDILRYPLILPINRTVHELYPGCVATATLNLFAYENNRLPGITAAAPVIVFKRDDERFGGGVTVDEDEMFSDD